VEYNEIVERHIAESVYYEHYAGYCNDEGYYYINIGDRGEVYLSCKTDTEEKILFYLMKNLLYDIGLKLELSIRDIEQKNPAFMRFYSSQTAIKEIVCYLLINTHIKAPECLHSWGFCYPFLVLWYAKNFEEIYRIKSMVLAFKC
jgi:hypothetical protein